LNRNKLEQERQHRGGTSSYTGCASLTPEELIITIIIKIIILVYLRAQLNSQRPITKLAHDKKIYKEIQTWNTKYGNM
jgi:hypothetical protein